VKKQIKNKLYIGINYEKRKQTIKTKENIIRKWIW